MNILWNFLKDTRVLLALSIVEVILAVAGFGANYYNLFYGVLWTDAMFPILQFLGFIMSIPVYGFQLGNGIYLIVYCTRVLCGHRDPARFGSYLAAERNRGVCGCCAVFLALVLLAGPMEFAFHADPFVRSLGVWGAASYTFQAEFPGQLVMLGWIVVHAVAFVVAVLIAWGSANVYQELKGETNSLDHSGSQNSAPPLYKKINSDPIPDACSTECLLSNAVAS
ncbi:uncharacterized protein LOC129597289 [Paramacrobiotus metropolitanus]|uniref:uncharacterized protein LOC129597289 n=1 Tax=Paramacrobiotus metropolitanus TaxID=2943436 RepID=UPI002445709D|nr:uncharacterized protein LOC129597289 [Paramacrobiotus metropolitanus]XP_055350748.1 uncharacterized protein LOC129597289 [Paramacrobiotus metropolitanus]